MGAIWILTIGKAERVEQSVKGIRKLEVGSRKWELSEFGMQTGDLGFWKMELPDFGSGTAERIALNDSAALGVNDCFLSQFCLVGAVFNRD